MEHPLKNELFLLKKAIHSAPPGFPADQKEKLDSQLKAFEKNPKASRSDIEAAIISAGKASWPYRQAYEEMVKNYGEGKKDEFFIKNLPNGLRPKYEDFIKKGGDIKNFRQGKEFEEAFTPEENVGIEQAFFSSREELGRYMQDVIKDHREEYNQLIEDYQKKQEILQNMLDSLEELAEKSDKWASQIKDKVKKFEEAWSVVERDFDQEQIKNEIEYWQGVLGLE